MKKFIAFWDIFYCVLGCIPLLILNIYIFVVVKGDADWHEINFIYSALWAFSLAIPFGLVLFFLQRMEIDLSRDYVHLYYMTSWGPKNNLDLKYNWQIFPSEIEKVSLVKLSKEEKKKYTSSKFLFSKYLKIELRHGAVKYIYVSHYANFQIKKIIRLLTSNLYKNTKISHRH